MTQQETFSAYQRPTIDLRNREAPTMYYCWSCLGGLDGDLDGVPGLTSAGVAWRNPGDGFTAYVPDSDPLMIDSGGFQAATRWNHEQRITRNITPDSQAVREFGVESRYPYTPRELHEWAENVGANIVAGMDVACEDAHELFDAAGVDRGYIYPGHYRDRMLESLDNQLEQQWVYENGEYSHEFMPVIQGKNLEDYEEFIGMMQSYGLDKYEKLAIGTVCKRTGNDEILEVVKLVRDYYPEKYIHLFGATLNVWKDRRFWGLFDSSDTAAWKFHVNNKEHAKELLEEYMQKVGRYAEGHEGQTSFT